MIDKALLLSGKKCTGCGACDNGCPVDAITMKSDKWGFLYPSIDLEKCIECNKCESICPKLHANTTNSERPKCYAAQAEENLRYVSSSGGAFSVLANYVLQKDGVVCGAAFDEELRVSHICINNLKDLEILRKSKYVQSRIGYVYREIKKFARQGRMVLFVGTPCQVAGLYNFLNDETLRKKVVLVDFLCGGNPSPKMLDDYLNENFDVSRIKRIDFRPQSVGWKDSAITLEIDYKDGSKEYRSISQSAYEKGYHRYLTKRECCLDCEFCGYQRQGDITIGDFWGIDRYDKQLTDGKGTSVIYVNNEKGLKMLMNIKHEFSMFVETPLEASRFNSIIKKRKPHPMRKRFFSLYPQKSFTESVEQCMEEKHDVIILGNVAGMNYGSHLTHYALYSVLTDMGFSTGVLNVPQDAFIKASDTPRLFSENPYPSWDWCKRYNNKTEMKELNEKCEAFITGSDQQFVSWIFNNDGKFVTQPFVRSNKRKITYAASLGHDRIFSPEQERAIISFFLKRFDAISVREDTAVALFDREFGVSATCVLDPVFLMSKNRYQRLIDHAKQDMPKEPFLFTYTLDLDNEKECIIKQYAKDNNLKIYAITDIQNKNRWSIPTVEKPDLETWLSYFAHCDFVITDSFHGTCLAIIFHKQFFSLVNKKRGATRFESLLRIFNLEDYAVYSDVDMKRLLNNWKPIDFSVVDTILQKERIRCREWLNRAIQGSGTKKSWDTYDVLDDRIDKLEKHINERIQSLLDSTITPLLEISVNEFKNRAEIGGLIKDTIYPLNKQLSRINDIFIYLLELYRQHNSIEVYITVKDTLGFALDQRIQSAINRLGIKSVLINKHWCPFIAFIDRGTNRLERIGEPNSELIELIDNNGMKAELISSSFNAGNRSSIVINGIEYSKNARGLNIVVVDMETHQVVDSVAFDTHKSEFTCYR